MGGLGEHGRVLKPRIRPKIHEIRSLQRDFYTLVAVIRGIPGELAWSSTGAREFGDSPKDLGIEFRGVEILHPAKSGALSLSLQIRLPSNPMCAITTIVR